MKNFLKIFVSTIFLGVSLFAADKEVINFEKKRITANPNAKLNSITIKTKKELPVKGWYGYILDINVSVGGKEIKAKDLLFSDGKYISLDLLDAKTGNSLKDSITPSLSADYYDKSKLIAGNHNAKDKIVVFSDPVCPFCVRYVPDVIKYVKKHKNKIALYYYHFPLTRIHPVAMPLAKIMEYARHLGLKDVELKVYSTDWEKYFDAKETDEKKVLKAFNKVFKTNIKLEQIQDKNLDLLVQNDLKMGEEAMVQGTPTVFVNGEKDSGKIKYLDLGK